MNFALKTTINRVLKGVTLTHYVVTVRTIPMDVQRRIRDRKYIWTWGKYDHEITVRGDGFLFTHRWNSNDNSIDSLNRRFLAEKVYDYQQRAKYVERKAA